MSVLLGVQIIVYISRNVIIKHMLLQFPLPHMILSACRHAFGQKFWFWQNLKVFDVV